RAAGVDGDVIDGRGHLDRHAGRAVVQDLRVVDGAADSAGGAGEARRRVLQRRVRDGGAAARLDLDAVPRARRRVGREVDAGGDGALHLERALHDDRLAGGDLNQRTVGDGDGDA